MSCTYGEQTVDVTSFNAYVDRTITIPDGVDPNQITTAVVVGPDGTSYPVPTEIVYDTATGHYVAVIHSLTNSVYTVIYNPVAFADVTTHWAKDAINNMGSRLVLTGVGDNNFAPDRDITRAEFAAIVVRALGLKPGLGKSAFSDVKAADWYAGYVGTAVSYGLITGYANGTFGPNDRITREQALTILARAMKLTGLEVSLGSGEAAADPRHVRGRRQRLRLRRRRRGGLRQGGGPDGEERGAAGGGGRDHAGGSRRHDRAAAGSCRN